MKKLVLALFVLSLAACSSLKVSYDYDSQADFSKYKTFAFSEEALKLPIQQLNRDRVLNAVETEMKAKGFTKVDSNPDVWVELFVKAEEKMDATATTTGPGYGGYYGRYGYGAGFSTTQINYNKYVEGTLFVNIVDKAVEKVVWQGRGTRTIDEDASAEKREKNITYGVQQIFTKYPPVKKK